MKIGRNDPCPCDSGKKYKKCCLDKDQQDRRKKLNEFGYFQPQKNDFNQWERLHEEEKLNKISYEMLDDWMQEGYKYLESDYTEACKKWLTVSCY